MAAENPNADVNDSEKPKMQVTSTKKPSVRLSAAEAAVRDSDSGERRGSINIETDDNDNVVDDDAIINKPSAGPGAVSIKEEEIDYHRSSSRVSDWEVRA